MTTVDRASVNVEEMERLTKVARLGFGNDDVVVRQAGGHTSKSCSLPILAAHHADSNVGVTNLSYNWYFHFLGVDLSRPVNAMLLYPISGAFGRYALSRHTDRKSSPPIGNFLREYHAAAEVQRWGMNVGSALKAAMVIRHLQEASKIDIEQVMDVCLRRTNHGRMDAVDGNAVDFDRLTRALGLGRLGKSNPYGFDVALKSKRFFKRIDIDWFSADGRGHNLVHVELADSATALLPAMTLPADVLVDLRDTPLAAFVPESAHARRVDGVYGKPELMIAVPPHLFSFKERSQAEHARLNESAYPAHHVYDGASLDTVRFTFKTPDPLCAAMTAWFLNNVVGPVLGAARATGVTAS